MKLSGHEGQRDHDDEDEIGGRGLDPDGGQEQDAERDGGVVAGEREGKRPEQPHSEAQDDRQRQRGSAEHDAQRQKQRRGAPRLRPPTQQGRKWARSGCER